MNLNKVYLLGTLSREPETRETHCGTTVTRIMLSVSRDYFSRERNQRVRETDSIEVQAWGPPGAARRPGGGSSVFVEGRLKLDSWETPTGERRQRLVVHLENFASAGSPAAAATPPARASPLPRARARRRSRARRARQEGGVEGGRSGADAGPGGGPESSGRRKPRRASGRRGRRRAVPRRDGSRP